MVRESFVVHGNSIGSPGTPNLKTYVVEVAQKFSKHFRLNTIGHALFLSDTHDAYYWNVLSLLRLAEEEAFVPEDFYCCCGGVGVVVHGQLLCEVGEHGDAGGGDLGDC